MNMFCGDMGCDLWSRELWKKHFSENMVIVCTAEVLRQCLHHSFISMDQINLLIFDEAHHAKKDHSYARIIKDFYINQGTHVVLPKIFGMTASPVDARTDVKKAATELEGILHCEIATAGDETLGGLKINSTQELMAVYDQLGPVFETPLYQKMRHRFEKNPVFRKPLLFSRESTRELGAWCSDQVWPFCLSDDEMKKLLAKTERQYHWKKVQEPLEALEKRKALLVEARDIVKSHIFEEPDFRPASGMTDKASSSNLSSKVVLLINYLRERFKRPTDDKAIIFVKQRYTARLLARLFSHPNIGTRYLKCSTLVNRLW
jgi:endoribonuclease Dicer